MAFANMKPAQIDEAGEQRDSNFLEKKDLVGAIIAVDVVDYDPKYEGNFGANPRVTVDMIVCSGPHKGKREDSKYFSNNLAVQINKAAAGGSTVVRVVSGKSKYGTDWFGVEAVSEQEFADALALVQEATSQAAPAPF